MESDRSSGSVYRLVVSLSGHDVAYGSPPFRSRKRAVAHVATAVRRHADLGAITAVTLEGTTRTTKAATQRPAPTNGNGNGRWHALERWDGAVVRRILDQWSAAAGAIGPPQAGPPCGPLPETPGRADAGSHRSGAGDARDRVAPDPVGARDVPGTEDNGRRTSRALQEASSETPTQTEVADDGEHPLSNAESAGCPPEIHARSPAAKLNRSIADTARKGHRWHTAVMLVLAGLVWVSLAVLLAGGHLSSLFTDAGLQRPQVVSELPFDAPAAGEPYDSPASFEPGAPPPPPVEDGVLLMRAPRL